MSKFNRGLSDGFVEALKSNYSKPESWWRPFLNNKESVIAIRKNYLNVYYRGASLLELRQSPDKTIRGSIDYKYLLRPKLEPAKREYVAIVDGKPCIPEDAFMKDLNEIGGHITDLQKAAKPYTDAEKTGVHHIFQGNPNILDVEIAITGDRETSSRRLDFAAVQEADLAILFYEAKTFANLIENETKVVEQMERYTHLLEECRSDIVRSYGRICKNLYELYGLTQRHPKRHEFLGRILNKTTDLHVDVQPILVVFGFDDDQKKGRLTQLRNRLEAELGKNMVVCRGEARDWRLPLQPAAERTP